MRIKDEHIHTICTSTNYPSKIPVVELFIQNTKQYPNIIVKQQKYDADKFYEWCLQQPNLIEEPILYNAQNANLTINHMSYMFMYSNELYIYYDNARVEECIAIVYLSDKDLALRLLKEFEEFKIVEEREAVCNIISTSPDGRYYLNELSIKDINLNVAENYNDSFIPVDKHIKETLLAENGKGILLLHGMAGTGKTNYIRHLINFLNEKKQVVYLPPALTNSLTDPQFVSFLINECTNTVIIIEDAEQAIKSRKSGLSSDAISNLLNISDGLLNDALKIQIVTTFNTSIADIDEALKRKGRIIAEYKFDKLSVDKAQKLSEKLGFTSVINEPMTLADIYNQDAQDFSVKSRVIGFKNNTHLIAP